MKLRNFDKSALSACQTWKDASDFFASLFNSDLALYCDAMEAAKDYAELTMRDLFLLQVAQSEKSKRNSDSFAAVPFGC